MIERLKSFWEYTWRSSVCLVIATSGVYIFGGISRMIQDVEPEYARQLFLLVHAGVIVGAIIYIGIFPLFRRKKKSQNEESQ